MYLKRWLAITLAWLSFSILFAVLQGTAMQLGLEYHINVVVLWPLFGAPDDIYSFRNLAVPRILAYIVTSIPAFLAGLITYQSLSQDRWKFALISIVLIIGPSLGFAIVIGLAGGTTDLRAATHWSTLFHLYLTCITVLAGYLLQKAMSVQE